FSDVQLHGPGERGSIPAHRAPRRLAGRTERADSAYRRRRRGPSIPDPRAGRKIPESRILPRGMKIQWMPAPQDRAGRKFFDKPPICHFFLALYFTHAYLPFILLPQESSSGDFLMSFLSILRVWRHELAAGWARRGGERKRNSPWKKRRPVVESLEERLPAGS